MADTCMHDRDIQCFRDCPECNRYLSEIECPECDNLVSRTEIEKHVGMCKICYLEECF